MLPETFFVKNYIKILISSCITQKPFFMLFPDYTENEQNLEMKPR